MMSRTNAVSAEAAWHAAILQKLPEIIAYMHIVNLHLCNVCSLR